MNAVLFWGFGVIFLVLIAVFIVKVRQIRLARWQGFAARHGLDCSSSLLRRPRLSGTTQGATISAEMFSKRHTLKRRKKTLLQRQAWSRLGASSLLPMPPGTLIRREGMLESVAQMFGEQEVSIGDPALDEKFWIRCDTPEAIREILAEPELREALLKLRRNASIRAESVVLEARGDKAALLEELLAESLELARLMSQARRYPWEQVAERLGLALTEDNATLTLIGEHAGIEVSLTVALSDDLLTITAPLHGMPAGLSITAGRSEGALSLGDPILDGAVTAGGEEPEVIRALLRDDAIRGVLLSVIHAWPGSSVTQNAITLRRPGAMVAGLEARLEEVATLARLLDSGSQR